MSSSSRLIRQILTHEASSLGKLVSKVYSLGQLQALLEELIEPSFKALCHVGSYQQGILTLFTPNAAVATRLRYQVPQLLSQLRQQSSWAGVSQIQVKVDPQWHTLVPKEPPKEPLAKIPKDSADAMMKLADSLPDLPDSDRLKQSLIRLAKHKVS